MYKFDDKQISIDELTQPKRKEGFLMAYDHGFGQCENELVDACTNHYPPDFEKIRQLMEAGIEINATASDNPDENILSTTILGYPRMLDSQPACEGCNKESCDGCSLRAPHFDGRYLPHVIALFLEHGFHVTKNGGRFGAMCLQNLTWSSYDRYIIDGTKLLLKAGADPSISPYSNEADPESVMSWVAEKESAGDCIDNDHALSNLFHTMYEIMDAAVHLKPFEKIEYFEVCVGKPIDKVELCTSEKLLHGISQYFDSNETKHSFLDTLVFWCAGVPLCINQYTDMLVDWNIPENAVATALVDHYFEEFLGQTIASFSFSSNCFVE